MSQLAIRGHETRGKEVIEILEMLGGINIYDQNGKRDIWYILSGNTIDTSTYLFEEKGFTLEEFLEKFPYKVGDKVTLDNKLCSIIWMYWECNNIYYQVQGTDTTFSKKVTANKLKPYKEGNYCQVIGDDTSSNGVNTSASLIDESIDRTNKVIFDTQAQSCDIMNDIIKKIKIDIPKDYEFVGIDDNKIVLTLKQPQYPKTYVECAKILNCFSASYIDGYKNEVIEKLQELLICRDAYWKIAGEQMALDKPWGPDWGDENEIYYTISYDGINIKCYNYTDVYSKLAFPTEAMRDTFYDNFKDLIEECKELL